MYEAHCKIPLIFPKLSDENRILTCLATKMIYAHENQQKKYRVPISNAYLFNQFIKGNIKSFIFAYKFLLF